MKITEVENENDRKWPWPEMTGNKITIFKVSFFVDFILCSVFKSSLNHNYPEAPFPVLFLVLIDDRRLPSFKPRPGLNRWPVFGTIGCSFDCWCKDTKIFCIYQILACDKGRFSAKTLTIWNFVKKRTLFLMGRISMFLRCRKLCFAI